jgi:pyruvate dehydrogenase E1 component alpha subunit
LIEHAKLKDAYRAMLLVRAFEERVGKLFAEGVMHGTSHLCIGQEAVPVGVSLALGPDDRVISNHRSHGHFIALGGDPKRIMAELFGKSTGYSGGRGGSQHMASFDLGYLGSNGITGSGVAIGTGAALAPRMRGEKAAVVSYLGDGAVNQGVVHEAFNMASLWRLPCVYVCENNLYAMSTPLADAVAGGRLSDRAGAYGMPALVVDGNDVLAVEEAARAALARARAGEGPTFLECLTYRLCGHSKSDRCVYRTREEEAEWRERCPIARARRLLIEAGAMTGDEDREIRDAFARAIDEAEEFARTSPEPDPATLVRCLYAESVPGGEGAE